MKAHQGESMAYEKAREVTSRHRQEMLDAGLSANQADAMERIFAQAVMAQGQARIWARMIAGRLGEQLMTKQLADVAAIAGSVACDCPECSKAAEARS